MLNLVVLINEIFGLNYLIIGFLFWGLNACCVLVNNGNLVACWYMINGEYLTISLALGYCWLVDVDSNVCLCLLCPYTSIKLFQTAKTCRCGLAGLATLNQTLRFINFLKPHLRFGLQRGVQTGQTFLASPPLLSHLASNSIFSSKHGVKNHLIQIGIPWQYEASELILFCSCRLLLQ